MLVLPYLGGGYDVSAYDGTLYHPLESVPRRYAISKRNEYMADNSDVVVAYVIYGFGGAGKTLEYAERSRKKIVRYSQ